MTLAPGTRLGPYEILAPLGAGGMGEVWKAKDTRLDRMVAIKVLPEHLAKSPESLARFEREAKAVAALNHPNITGIFDLGNADGVAFVAMELLEGESLRTRLEQGPLTPRKATELAIQMAQGLAAAHEKGVVHRDLKPDNLWITREGRLKILDFGLAKQLPAMGVGSDSFVPTAAIQAGHNTEKGMILGTLGYMSPEQVRGEAVDARADLFSFGVVLFEMLTGRRAFARDTASDTMAAILRDDPLELEGTSKPTPLALRRIIDHCLEKVPARRFQDARDVAFALESLSSPEASAPITAPFATQNQRTTWVWATLATLVVASAALCGWLLRGGLAPSVTTTPVAVRLLTASGHDVSPAASPDGRTIAFCSDRDGRPRIWLKQLKGGGEVALTAGDDNFPRFSPDGSSVLFIHTEGTDNSLYRVGLLGTDPRKVAGNATSGDWSPKGDQIVFIRDRNEGAEVLSSVIIIGAGGGAERLVAQLRNQLVGNPRWSPDGRFIAFTNSSVQQGGGVGKAYVVDATSGAVKVFDAPNRQGAISSLAWISPEEFLYFQSETVVGNGTAVSPSRAYRQDAQSGAITVVFWSPTSGRVVDLLPDGRVIFDGMAGRQNLREYALTGKADPKWLTRGNINDRQPVYSRDGEWVVFSSNRSGNLNLWAVSPRTGNIRSLTDDEKQDWDPGVSTDGKHLLWSSNRSGTFEIWMANLDGTEAHQLSQDGVDAENPTQTADGRWVVYMSGNAKQPGLWKVHPDGTEGTPIVPGNNILLPEVSPDGQYVAYLHQTNALGGTIRVARLEDGSPVPFSTPIQSSLNAAVTQGRTRWTPDGKHLVFTAMDAKGRFGVAIQDFVPGQDTRASRRNLAGFDPDWITESLGLSPDGKRLVLSESERVFSVMVAEGTGIMPRRGAPK
jgi:Tol biopolymer transport system component/serine/threonine protein kinase